MGRGRMDNRQAIRRIVSWCSRSSIDSKVDELARGCLTCSLANYEWVDQPAEF
jgi:hypothetical protein